MLCIGKLYCIETLESKIELYKYIYGVYLFWRLLDIYIFSFNAVEFGNK